MFVEVLDAVASPAFRRCGGSCCSADGGFGNAEEDCGIEHGFLFRPVGWVVASRGVKDRSKVHVSGWVAMVTHRGGSWRPNLFPGVGWHLCWVGWGIRARLSWVKMEDSGICGLFNMDRDARIEVERWWILVC